MNKWDKSNKACITLWSTLFGMQQLDTDFRESGSLKMSDLSFNNGSETNGSGNPEAIANRLDDVLSIGTGIKYESGIDRSTARSNLSAVLSTKENKVTDLADIIKMTYAF